jgi:hypothetical protein
MSSRSAVVAMIGMPSTGKSTYLAALYQTLSDPPPDVRARLARQPAQRAYLEELRQAWLRGEPVGRTRPDSGELVELEILVSDQDEVRLAVPDIAGETFENILVKRQADALVANFVTDANGLLLFTHPDHQRPRVPIATLRRMQELVGEQPADGEDVDEKPFDAKEVPGEVQLIDLLQWATRVRAQRSDTKPCRVALIVSAWDRAGNRAPADWITTKMPMLRRFLDSQKEHFATVVYGVCAQGGDYGQDDVAKQRPHGRSYILTAEGLRSDDLTAPLQWAAFE